jgi:hypothetical protein
MNKRAKICLGLVAVGCVSAVVVLGARPSLARNSRDSIARLAEPVLAAAQQWHNQNAEGCPTIGALINEGLLDRDVEREDPWGGTLRLVCLNDGQFRLLSPGQDGQLGTEDDIEWPQR